MNRTSSLSGRKATSPEPVHRVRKSIVAVLEKIFGAIVSSSERAARIRQLIVWMVFLIIVIPLVWRSNPAGWESHIQPVFVAMFTTKNSLDLLLALFSLIIFSLKTILAASVLKPLIILLGPFLLAWQIVAVYLQDIFELEHTGTARRYIMQAAFADEYDQISIREGTIDLRKSESPLIQIGGPGIVQVELDSVALFEKVDGSSRVIGPTVEGRHYQFIDSFERLRDVIDLRDLSTGSMTNSSRSRDGIPVVAKDVRMIYSVQRGNAAPTLDRPYPFTELAIRQLVYQQTTNVNPGQPKTMARDNFWKQRYERWSGAMPSLIHSSLSDFVSEHNLSEFLASIGEIELGALHPLDADGNPTSKTNDNQENSETRPSGREGAGKFMPRNKITSLFYDFASGFPRRAENKGVQLEWIGVGTWSTPVSAQLISESHFDAWRISRENYLRGHQDELERLRQEARFTELHDQLHKTLLSTFQRAVSEALPTQDVFVRLLLSYRDQMKVAWDLFERDRDDHPEIAKNYEKLTTALRILNGFLAHYINKSQGTA